MILMIDNFDSFCYNIYQYLRELGEEVEVVRNNALSMDELRKKKPDRILISPGPCSPKESGISMQILRELGGKVPIFGVCLGHQVIGEVFGGKIVPALRPVHGQVHEISHDGKGVFLGVEDPLPVTRYHSLIIEKDSLPDCLCITAESKEGEIMGVRHREYAIEGVQFHPEAILTKSGHEIFRNFIRWEGATW